MSSKVTSNPPTKRASLEAMDAPREGGRSGKMSASTKPQPVKLVIAIMAFAAAAFVIYWFNFHESGGPNVQRADQPMSASTTGPATPPPASPQAPGPNSPASAGTQATGTKPEPIPEPVGTSQLAPGVQ